MSIDWTEIHFDIYIYQHQHHHNDLQTTSGEDVRDFTKLLRNKLMSRKSKKNSRLGYLPVQVGDENDNDHVEDHLNDDDGGDDDDDEINMLHIAGP